MRFVAYTIKGLEETVEKELLEKLGAIKVVQKGDKVIVFDYEGKFELLTKLRTADDIGEFVCPLDSLQLNNLSQVLESIKTIRQLGNTFSITTSIASVETDKETLIKKVSDGLSKLGLTYTPDNRSNLDFRIFLNKDIGFLAIRLTKEPLNKRNYEVGNYLGALKSTIASTMVQIATENLPKQARIVDDFCGSGTILCEAFLNGFPVYGGDISSEAVTLTTKRLKMLGSIVSENIKVQDATKTKWNASYFDCAISNLPWDKQHEITHITELYANTIKEYKRILKPKFRLCVICHKPELLVKHIKKEFGDVSIKRIDIGYLGQTPSIILASND